VHLGKTEHLTRLHVTEPNRVKVKKQALWTAIAIGLITSIGIFIIVQGVASGLSNLSGEAERWETLMRRLRR
jgi:hypothetical protein